MNIIKSKWVLSEWKATCCCHKTSVYLIFQFISSCETYIVCNWHEWLPLTNPQMYCFGCGTNVTNKPADRRALQGSGSQQVVELWTTVCESLEDAKRPSIDLNMLISGGGDPTRSGRMCRKCFYAYERYLKLHDSLQENLKKHLMC